MRVLAVLVLALLPGCGGPTADHSPIQSPNDQPIGPPQFQKDRGGPPAMGPLTPASPAVPVPDKVKVKP